MIYTKSCTNIEADDKCAVCLSEYLNGEKLKRLRCKHFFHSECIDPWLKVTVLKFYSTLMQYNFHFFRHQLDVRSVEVNRQVK
jgi:hypothetical protein